MINVKAIGASCLFVLASVSSAQEAPTHHGYGTVDSGTGTRRSGPDGAGSGSDDTNQQHPGTPGGGYFDGHPGDGLDTGADFSNLPDGGSNFPGDGNHHGAGGHDKDGFNGMGGGFFGGGAGGFGGGTGAGGGSQGQGSGTGSGSQGQGSGAGNDPQGQTGTGPDTGSAPPLLQAFFIPEIDGPTDDGDKKSPPSIFDDPPPPFGPSFPSPFGPPPPDGNPPPGPSLDSKDVPEPFTLSLFASGLAGAAALRRRRNKKT